MKKISILRPTSIFLLTWLFIGIQSTACKTSVYQDTKVRDLPSFSELSLAISADVILSQGTTQKVEIVASDRLLKLIETEVKNGVLTIKWAEKFVTHTENIKIYITMVDIEALRISGSGDIVAEDEISTGDIQLSISGSGDIKLAKLKAENIKSTISGSADISISGNSTVSSMEASISGSGDILAPDLPVKNVEISISGSGNCRVNALEMIKAKIAGSGDIFYSGNATVDAKVSGSGSVQHVNK